MCIVLQCEFQWGLGRVCAGGDMTARHSSPPSAHAPLVLLTATHAPHTPYLANPHYLPKPNADSTLVCLRPAKSTTNN